MTKSNRPEPFFIAEDRALDLLNSIGTPRRIQIEWLKDGEDLLAWLEQAGLIPPQAAERMRQKMTPEALDGVAAQARSLREWFRQFVKTHAGQRIEPSALNDLERLNRILAGDKVYSQIAHRETNTFDTAPQSEDLPAPSLHWQHYRHWQSPEDLLLPIAQAMGDLVCQANFERVKNCEGPTCTMWFHDTSKNHTRRWCTMAVCGNRAKAAAHREKQRTQQRD